jgi:RNA polymerase subunit RPABC4/transcription elongation factor Spt4
MVKIPSLSGLRRQQQPSPSGDEDAQPAQQAQMRQPRPPTPGQLRRERRALVRAREERVRDLGGLLLEMYKREHFREDLYLEQSAEIVAMEDRIRDLDDRLAAATRQTLSEADRCACGAPLVWGAHFCANCGRSVGEQTIVACANCGASLPAEASFCPSCGRPAEAAEQKPTTSGKEDTVQLSSGTAGSQGR